MDDYDNIDILATQLNNMDSDIQRWQYVFENSDKFIVKLDNDETYLHCVGDDRDEPAMIEIDWYIGNSDGIQHLLDALGVESEGV